MIKVEIKADSKYPVNRRRIRRLVRRFLEKEMEVTSDMYVGIVVVGDRKMKQLNKKYLDREETTDVLSFSQVESKGEFIGSKTDMFYLGDVVVSWPQAMKQALDQQIPIDEEVDFLVKHGLLHLMGVHHDEGVH